MAITQISQIKLRRGLQQDLPQLGSAELGWSVDSRRLYIGNGTISEGAPVEGHTEILTEFSIANFTTGFTANFASMQSNVTVLQGNVVTINAEIAALQSGTINSNYVVLSDSTSGVITHTTSNNGVISYTLSQGTKQRTGSIKFAFSNSTVMYDEEYTEDATTQIAFTMTANSTQASLNYNTAGAGTTTSLLYQLKQT